jgi:hypothetical protein
MSIIDRIHGIENNIFIRILKFFGVVKDSQTTKIGTPLSRGS